MDLNQSQQREITWTSWQFFISQMVTILVAAVSLWYAAQSGYGIAKKSDRVFELRQAINMISALQAEVERNIHGLTVYQDKIRNRMQSLRSKDHRKTLPFELKVRDDLLKTTVEKDFLYVVDGKILSAIYAEYDSIREAYLKQWGTTAQGRRFAFVLNQEGMLKRIAEYEVHRKSLTGILKGLGKVKQTLEDERRELE